MGLRAWADGRLIVLIGVLVVLGWIGLPGVLGWGGMFVGWMDMFIYYHNDTYLSRIC